MAVVRAQGAVFTRHDEAVPHGRRLRRRPDPRRADHARQLRDAGLGIGPAGPAHARWPGSAAACTASAGAQHSDHRRILGAVLGSARLDAQAAHATMDACAARWAHDQAQPLLARMRELCICLASHHLLGPDAPPALPDLIYRFFHLRRQASSPTYAVAPGVQEDLLATGARLDAVLRQHLRRQAGGQCSGAWRPGRADGSGRRLTSEDEAVGHANILFVSATEPVAVALTWTLLVLSQAPHWREAARNDAGALEGVLLESLRMLPPNTFMSRVATGGAVLGGVELPARTELVISAFAEHRDGAVFADPDTFMPQRWRSARPGAFQFMPFGA
ncbi:cytochrome P450 [Massilia sp. H-1]|nr:cytochrome P450 [Massilia sp. H-1]